MLMPGVLDSEGPFQVVAFDSGLPVLLMPNGEQSAWDGSNISKVINPEKPQEIVDLGTQQISTDPEAAAIIKAIIETSKAKDELIKALESGDGIAAIKAERDAALEKVAALEASKSKTIELLSKVDADALKMAQEELSK